MELQLEQQQIPCLIISANRCLEERFSIDAVIPDSMPDASALLITEGELCVWRLDLSDGNAELEGEVAARVCYTDDHSKLIGIPVRVPVQMRIRDEKIKPGQRPFLKSRIVNLKGQLLNSRKVRVLAMVQCSLSTYDASELTLTTGIISENLHPYVRKAQETFPYLSAVEEQVIAAEETIPLQRGIPTDGRIISYASIPIADECACRDRRVAVKGRIRTSVLYQDTNDQKPITEVVETPFSGILDVNGEVEKCRLSLHFTSEEIRCRNDDPAVDTAFHVLVQAICYSETTVEHVADAYSNRAEIRLNWMEQLSAEYIQHEPVQRFLEEEIACDLTGKTICAVFAGCRGEAADVTVLLQDLNNKFTAAVGVIKSEQEIAYLEQPSVQSGKAGLLVRAPVMIREETETPISIPALVSADVEEQMVTPLSGFTFVRREETMNLWNLAKENKSSLDAIQAANPDRDQPNQWLVLPHVN